MLATTRKLKITYNNNNMWNQTTASNEHNQKFIIFREMLARENRNKACNAIRSAKTHFYSSKLNDEVKNSQKCGKQLTT